MLRFIALILFCLMLLPLSALAQGYAPFLQSLSDYNKIQPLQNPSYKHADDMNTWRILDRKNKVVGSLKDVVITPNGSVASLAVEFDRLHLSNEVFVNYRQLSTRPVTNGFALGLGDDQIENLYPNLLANIETAAGGASDIYSASSIMGSSVRSADGRNLGKVQNILFGGGGDRAEALYLSLEYGTARGKNVAIPFGQAKFQSNGSRTDVLLSKEQADALIEFVAAR